MTDDENEVEITVRYRLDDRRGGIRCDFAGENPELRHELSEELFGTVVQAVLGLLESEGVTPVSGGEIDGENAVTHAFGPPEDIMVG